MMRSMLASILCLALLALSTATRGHDAEEFARAHRFSQNGNSTSREERLAAALTLPGGKDAWLIEIGRSGGMRPFKNIVRLNSDGEISVVSEQFKNGAMAVECARKEKLSARDLLKIKAAITSAKPSLWKNRYSDPAHPECCDQPTTNVNLQRREDNGRERSYSASWYPASYGLVPADLKAIATFIQPLWDATRARCDK